MTNAASQAAYDENLPPGEPRSQGEPSGAESPAELRPRIWPGVLIVAIYWGLEGVLASSDMVITTTFMLRMLLWLVMPLACLIWWLTDRRRSWRDRLLPPAVAVAAATACVLVSLSTLGPMNAVFAGLPLMWSAWVAWLVVSRRASERLSRAGLVVVIVLVWSTISLIRVDGLDGRMLPSLHWRWTPTSEDLYLAERATASDDLSPVQPTAEVLVLSAGDWPCFRGPGFLGQQQHEPIASDWNESPPKELWRRRVGPAWSSFVVIGTRLFTQEQRGEEEATVCLDAATGNEIWAHTDSARFWDGQAGAGPRGTPTFHDGRLYSYGATGILNCLDAATGKLLWTHDIVAETGAPLPMWGFASSPLVIDGLVIVFAGAPDGKGLVAYHADTGEPAWNAAAGAMSYSTAQLVNLDGQPQVLLLTDAGVAAVEPSSGKRLWHYDADATGMWRVIQPRQVGPAAVLIGSEDLGLRLLDVTRDGDTWATSERWASRAMRPAYNDFVVVDNVAYGFDKGFFCAVDMDSGKRLWKGGRYGYGQVLLLEPQNLLVVLSERGEVVLLAANPEKLEELGRIDAITGKTWNHPVVAHGRLYVRNDAEMAAFDLAPAAGW